MNGNERGNAYLTIPGGYGYSLGGPRWSLRCDAVEWPDGSALALAEELRPLLEGVFSRPTAQPFAFVLNALHLMKSGVLGKFDRLRAAFESARGSVGLYRHAGLLIAELCDDLPPSPEAATFDDVAAALQLRQAHGERHRPELAADPPLSRFEFEQHVAARLEQLDDAALSHWLRYGTAPPPPTELPKVVESLPARVARLLARARQRPRLVGAATLAPVIDAALTLPPRRRTPDPLPQGGYADVTTRGEPERLLPAQFALDDDEFIRRFAENELLFFEREEPHAAEKPGRILVLDQGVRTWGSVRLALAAAVFALLKKDPKRIGRVRLALTSSPELIDVADADIDALAESLEASDLTATPAACLTLALNDAADEPRDVVILTHPRALRESAVIVAGKLRRPADRIFALGVDETGKAEFAEWSAGGLVPIRTFRIDLALGEAARVATEPVVPTAARWGGDAESVGFPFRPGLVAEPLHLGFDADGEWLVIAARDGVLHGMGLDETTPEVLPRAFRAGVVLKSVDAVLGVRGGVVVCGRMGLLTPAGPKGSLDALVAAHYDRATRRVTLHELGRAEMTPLWLAYPDLHCVAARYEPPNAPIAGRAIDLSTLGLFPSRSDAALVSRARAAWDRGESGAADPRELPVVTHGTADSLKPPGCVWLHGNELWVRHVRAEWVLFERKINGLPLLAGAAFDEVRYAAGTLCALVARGGERTLMLFRAPGTVLGELPHHRGEPWALSSDGRLLARRRWHREVVVSETGTPSQSRVVVTEATLHNGLGVRLEADPFRLVVSVGGFAHAFTLSDNRLSHDLTRGVARAYRPEWTPSSPLVTDYDPTRFPRQGRAAAGPLRAVLDRLGQVVLLAESGAIVASFVVRRDRAAAWLPGDIFWGDATLIGGPPTHYAARAFAAAITSAGG